MNHNYTDNRKGEYYGNDNMKRKKKFHHRKNSNLRRYGNNENHYENHHHEVRDFKENRYSDKSINNCAKTKLNPAANQFGGNCSTSTPKKTKQINETIKTDHLNLSTKSIQTSEPYPPPPPPQEDKKLDTLVELSEFVDSQSGEKKYICNRCKCVKDDLIQSKIEVEQWFENENNNIFAGYMQEKVFPEQQQDFGNLSAIRTTEEELLLEDMIHLKLNKNDLTPPHLFEYKPQFENHSNVMVHYDGSNDSMLPAKNQLDHMPMYVPLFCVYPVANGEESPLHHQHHHHHHSMQHIQNPADYSFTDAAQIANVSGPPPYAASCHFAAFYFTNYYQQPQAPPQSQNY